MTEYYDLSDVKMPEGTTCLQNIISNKKIPSYELSISLFDKCQLNCDFCFQAHKKEVDIEYIKSIPEKVLGIVPRLIQRETKTLHIRLWGGELFHDGISDELFELYDWLCTELKNKFYTALPNIKIYFNFMSNGAWKKNRKNVEDLLKKHNAVIGFSYDPVGRYPNQDIKNLALETMKHFYDWQGHVNLAMTTTKRNIECLLNEEDPFLKNFPKQYSLEINYYIPSEDWKINLPNDELLFKMWKYFLDNSFFNCKSLHDYIQPIFYPNREFFSTCGCKCSDQFSNNCLIRDCISRTSRLGLKNFYGDLAKDLNDENAQEIKNYLGTIKRGCLYCENLSRCAWLCFSSILFKEYKAENCPINQLINYIDKNKDTVKQNLEKFKEKYDLSKVFYNPSI